MPEDTETTPRKFPPVSVTRFVPVTRPAEGAAAVATPRGAPAPSAETFEPPRAEPRPLPVAPAEEPLAEFLPDPHPGPTDLATFTPVGRPVPPPPTARPAPAAVANARPEPGLGARLAPSRQAPPPRPAAAPPPAALPVRPAPEPAAQASGPAAGVQQPVSSSPLPGILQPLHFGLPSTRAERPEPPTGKSRLPAMLVVDDNPDYRFVVVREMRRLRPNSLRIEEADSAQAALNLLTALVRENERIFVLTDFRMPNQTGVDLVAAARRAYPALDIRYLVYSGINLRTSPELRNLGPDEFMEKPGDLIELRRQVGRLLERWLGPVPQARIA